jgi:WD40 repeat protein
VLLALGGCGDALRFPLSGPGLHRVISQGGLGPLRFWWLPPDKATAHARLLLWDGVSVGISDPALHNQSFTALNDALFCSQVAPAPDGHAFVCGQQDPRRSATLVQSLNDLQAPPLLFEGAQGPFSWSPDSREVAGVRVQTLGGVSTCSVVTLDTTLDAADPDAIRNVLEQVPFVVPEGTNARLCPVLALAWSPDGARLALSLAGEQSVTIEVLRLGAPGAPPQVETRATLPGAAVQLLDSPEVPSLFWSPDGQMLAALTGLSQALEDGLYLLNAGQGSPVAQPNVVDTGNGAALAWSPNGHWLAVGAVGSDRDEDNARLRVYDRQQNHWRTVAPMYVGGPTLAWSDNGGQLAAASAVRQGIALWDWPSGRLSRVFVNQDIGQLEQLGWAQDNSGFFFTVGSHDTTPFYEELYAQTVPVPLGTAMLPYPDWFVDLLSYLQQWLVGLGAVLLGLVIVMAFLALTGYGRSQRRRRERRRSLILWLLGVSAFLFCVLLLCYGQLPHWTARLYQPYSHQLCRGNAFAPCDAAATLALLTLGMPLVLGALVVVLGTLLTSQRRRRQSGGPVRAAVKQKRGFVRSSFQK